MRLEAREIETDLTGLRLIRLRRDHAAALYNLIDRNRGHLTQHGDYQDLGQATPDSVVESLTNPIDQNIKYGIWLNDDLIGRVDLSPRDAGTFVIGYWLGSDFTGHGYATLACRSLINDAIQQQLATTIYAGVTKGNVKSEALLSRLGFTMIEDRGTYTLFRFTAELPDE